MLEVEVKAHIYGDMPEITARAESRGYEFCGTLKEHDRYFYLMDGGTAKKDTALRIRRQVCDGVESVFMAYKGPLESERINTREEIEFEVGSAHRAEAFLLALGHERALDVHKVRRYYVGGMITVAFDTLEGIGHFREIETLIKDAEDRKAAEDRLLEELDALLPGAVPERRTYLQMLMEQQKREETP